MAVEATVPKYDGNGRPYHILHRVPLRFTSEGDPVPPNRPEYVYLLVCDHHDDGRDTYWLWSDGSFGQAHHTFNWALQETKAAARSIDRSRSLPRMREAYVEGFERLYAMSSNDLVALGSTHRRYGKLWRALRNPLVLPRGKSKALRLDEKACTISKADVLEWLADRPWSPEILRMTVEVVKWHSTYLRFEMIVLDFDAPEQAFEFKMRWL
jgi:hypothetical protein